MGVLKSIEHGFKRVAIGALSPLLRRGREELGVIDPARLSRLLLIRPEKIGDMMVSLPTVDGIRSAFPHLKLGLVASPYNYSLVKDDPRFDEVYLYKKKPQHDWSTFRRIRAAGYDAVVDMIANDSVTAVFLTQLLAPGQPRIGLGKIRYARYYDFVFDIRRGETGHIIDNTKLLLTAFGIDPVSVSGFAEPYVPATARQRAQRFVAGVRSPSTFLVGLNLSAGQPSRYWPFPKWIALTQAILAEDPLVRIVVLTTPDDRQLALDLQAACGDRVTPVEPGLSLVEAAAVIEQLDLLISPDTSLIHIARSWQRPVVGLYCQYRHNYKLWQPYQQGDGGVISESVFDVFGIAVDEVLATYQRVRATKVRTS